MHVETSRRRQLGYIVTLDVAPAFRRRGLATELMRAVERVAAGEDCSAMLLHVHAGNLGAISFYRRLGFSTLHTVEDFYGEELDALLMHKLL